MNPEKPAEPDENEPGVVRENTEIDEFFQRLPANFRWPKPSEDAVAAAVEAIQRLSGASGVEDLPAETGAESSYNCAGCGGELPASARFCVWCGLAKNAASSRASTSAQTQSSGQHHYHHHYHHFAPGQGTGPATSSGSRNGRAMGKRSASAPSGSGNSRAEIAVRQIVQDWAQACNTKHLMTCWNSTRPMPQ